MKKLHRQQKGERKGLERDPLTPYISNKNRQTIPLFVFGHNQPQTKPNLLYGNTSSIALALLSYFRVLESSVSRLTAVEVC